MLPRGDSWFTMQGRANSAVKEHANSHTRKKRNKKHTQLCTNTFTQIVYVLYALNTNISGKTNI